MQTNSTGMVPRAAASLLAGCLAAAAAGYCGARGKYDDPDVVKAVSETLATLTQFLDTQLK